jgi:hypothetical protein
MKEKLRYSDRYSKFCAESSSRALTRIMLMQKHLMLKLQVKELKTLEDPSETPSQICVVKFSLMLFHF